MGSMVTSDEALQNLIDAAIIYVMLQAGGDNIEKADKLLDYIENAVAKARLVIPDLPNPD